MIDIDAMISAFTTLFVVIDPIGLAPIFVALTAGMAPRARRAIALRSCAIAAGLLLLFAFAGESVLAFVGISMPAFRIAGGLLLFLTALEMLFEKRSKRREDQADEDRDDPSVFPLAIPLIAGPGAIATIILLAGQAEGNTAMTIGYIGVMLVVVCLVFVMFLLAGLIEHLLGRTGINVVTRILGMLLAALSVQFVLDGMRSFGIVAG